jgi:hypothetical protein
LALTATNLPHTGLEGDTQFVRELGTWHTASVARSPRPNVTCVCRFSGGGFGVVAGVVFLSGGGHERR